jgi:hypothetical protein
MEGWLVEIIRHILTALVTAAVLYVLLRQSRRAPARELTGGTVLRQPPFNRIMGLVSAGVGLVMLVGSLLSFDWGRLRYDAHEQLGFGFTMFAALLFIGLSIPILQASATTLTLTPLGIASSGPRGQHRFLLWADITSVRYNHLTHELKITAPHASIKAGRYLVGFDYLVLELTRHLRLTPTQMGLFA